MRYVLYTERYMDYFFKSSQILVILVHSVDETI